jgi:hypothetical protein
MYTNFPTIIYDWGRQIKPNFSIPGDAVRGLLMDWGTEGTR